MAAAFDPLERGLLVLCALLLLGFTVVEIADVLRRNLRRPWLNANEFAAGFFVWGVFLGMSVAVRRDQHSRLTAIAATMHGAPHRSSRAQPIGDPGGGDSR